MLTNASIAAAIKNCTAERTLHDASSVRGGGSLFLRIRPGKAGPLAAWMVAWKVDGKRTKKQIGTFPEMSLAAARETVKTEVRPILRAGRDPKAEPVPVEDPNVENLFKRYVATLYARNAGAAKHIEHVLLLGQYAAADALGRLTLAADVTPADIRKPLVAAARRGALRTADILRTYMSSAFAWGMKSANDYTVDVNYEWGIKANPVAAVPKDPRANKTRDRNLTAEELKAVWPHLLNQSGDVMRLVILCGQRTQETIKADGVDIDLVAGLWHMPAHKTKGGKHPHTLPLPRQAVEIFRGLKELHGDGPLFPGAAASKSERMGFLAVSHAAARLKVDGCKPFQARDLRRTWKSRAGDAGVDRFMRDLIQQHAKGDTGSKFYDRQDYLPKMREAMATWADWVDANVIASDTPAPPAVV